jgi:hypothetical protein
VAKYRKVDPRIWNDEKFRSLTERGKLVFFFLLTHPHMTALGAMRATIQGLGAEYGVAEKAFREAFKEVLREGMVEVDEKASLMVLPKFIFYNRPESPNVLKAWGEAVELLPECDLRTAHLRRVKAFAEGLEEGFVKVIPEDILKGARKTIGNREQEQEQEQEERSSPTPVGIARVRFDEFWNLHHQGPKAEAAKEYRKLGPDVPPDDELLAILARQIEERKQADRAGVFVARLQDLVRWLRKRRWEDAAVQVEAPLAGTAGLPPQPTWKCPKCRRPIAPPERGGGACGPCATAWPQEVLEQYLEDEKARGAA